MKIFLAILLLSISVCGLMIPEKEESENRSKRSLATLLDAWIGGMALTGLRISYFPERIYHDVFGDKSKDLKEEMESVTKEKNQIYNRLLGDLENLTEVHQNLQNEHESQLNELKMQYKMDFVHALSLLQKEPLLKKLCRTEKCIEYSLDFDEFLTIPKKQEEN